MWLLIPFLILPVMELALILKVGGAIGFWPTLALMIGSAVAGSWLMRRQGAAALADLQRAIRDFRDPTAPLAHGALILLAGALMVAPGFLTDLAGLALVIPAVRRGVMAQLRRRMRVTSAGFGYGGTGPAADWPGHGTQPGRGMGPGVIDADYVVIDDDPPPAPPPGDRPRGPSGWTRH